MSSEMPKRKKDKLTLRIIFKTTSRLLSLKIYMLYSEKIYIQKTAGLYICRDNTSNRSRRAKMRGALPSRAKPNRVREAMYKSELLAEKTKRRIHALRIPGSALMPANLIATIKERTIDSNAQILHNGSCKKKVKIGNKYSEVSVNVELEAYSNN